MPKSHIQLAKNTLERFYYLQRPPKASQFRQGDICKVNKFGHKHHGQIVQVSFASGDRIEVRYRSEFFNLQSEDLIWLRFSPVSNDR